MTDKEIGRMVRAIEGERYARTGEWGSGVPLPPEDDAPQDPTNPSHYKQHPSGIEAIDVAEHMSFNLGNVVKYVMRAGRKGDPVEDLSKARWYLQREIERLEKEEQE